MQRTSWLRVVLVLPLLLWAAPAAWAGAWTLPRNRWYAEYFYRYLGSKKVFDDKGHSSRRPKVGVFSDIRNEWKLEYGLTDYLNLLASLPYQSSHYRDDSVDLLDTGIGDIYLRTKLRVLERPVVTSMQFSWKIPGGYDVKESPALGKGQFDFESRLLLSRSFPFAPYKVMIRRPLRQQTISRPSAAAPRSPDRPEPIQATFRPRDTAIRQALLTAALHERATRLDDTARYRLASASGEEAVEEPFKKREEEAPFERREEEEPFNRGEELVMETRYAKVAFISFEGGFTARNRAPANEVPLTFEAGITPLKRLMVIGSVESVTSIRSTHEQEEDFKKWGIRAIVNLLGDGFSSVFREGVGPTVNVEVGYNDVFAGRNTADSFEIFGKVGITF